MYVSLESPDVPTLTISWVSTVEGKKISVDRWSLHQAADFFTPSFPPVVTKEEREVKPLFSFNIYKSGTTRGKKNVEAMTGIVFDFDNKDAFVPIQTVLDRLNDKRIVYFFYTSHSHTAECPRWRLMIPFSQPLPVGDWNVVNDQMVILIGNPPGIDHSACRDVAHIWFPPYKNAEYPFEKYACREGLLVNPVDLQLLLTHEQQAEYARNQEAQQQKNLPVQMRIFPLTAYGDFTFQQAMEALIHISPDCSYDEWIRVGMALHFQFGGREAFSLWDSWSQKSPKYPGENILITHWKSFREKTSVVSIGTLIHLAQENGYVLFPSIEMNVIVPGETQNHDITEEDERLLEEAQMAQHLKSRELETADDIEEAQYSEESDQPVESSSVVQTAKESSEVGEFDFSEYEKVDIYDLPHPLLSEIYSYLFKCGRYQTPLYALGSAIPITGFLLRNHLQGFTGLRSNFMVLTIGSSGTGKSQVLIGIQKILIASLQQNHLVTSLGTLQGCIEALRKKDSSLLLVQDEATYWAKGAKNKNLSIHEDNVGKFRLEVFNTPPIYMPPAIKTGDLTPVESPFFAEISSATPDILKYLSPDDISKGLLPRYLVFRMEKNLLQRNPVFSGELPSSLLAQLERCKSLQNCDRLTGMFDDEAHGFFTRFQEKVEAYRLHLISQENHPHPFQLDALLARLCEHAEKLALLGGVRNVAGYTLPLKAIQWAIGVTLLSFRNMLQIMEDGMYENQTEEYRARVLNIVKKKSKGKWVTRSVISWGTRFLKARELQEILIQLQNEELIEISKNGENQLHVKYIGKGENKK